MKYIKSILAIIFPISGIIKAFSELPSLFRDLKSFNFWDSNLGWTIKLYALTLSIPLTSTILILFGSILGLVTKPFFTVLYDAWIGYYFTGSFLDIAAWRWHLFLFILAFLFTLSEKD